MKTENKKKLMHIMQLAVELNWLSKNLNGYPLMQASETEKCMLAMVDDFELKQMEGWVEDNKKQKRTLEKEKSGVLEGDGK